MSISYEGVADGFLRVTETIKGAHPKYPTYELLPDDLLCARPDGTYGKFNGLGIEGFVLTPEQAATLEESGEVRFQMGGVSDYLAGGGAA